MTPACEVASGDSIELAVPDASYGQIATRDRGAATWHELDFSRMNPLAGPVFVRGARAGDTLEVEILGVETDIWGWTGSSPASDCSPTTFRDHGCGSRTSTRSSPLADGVDSPVPAVPRDDRCRSRPTRAALGYPALGVRGNLDVRYLTVGATLFLPVGVDGALLSIGDGHAAQGDGEVCGSAIETGMEITVRVRVRSDLRISRPAAPGPGSRARGRGARTSRRASPTTFDRRHRMPCAP